MSAPVVDAPAMTAGPAEGTADTTVGALLADGIARLRASGAELPRLDAELLLGWAAGLDRTALIAHPERRLGAAAAGCWEAGLARRERGEPVAYIRAEKEFFGLTLRADARALIPRPETELLVDLALAAVEERLGGVVAAPGTDRLRIADVGTGSGAIAAAVAATLRERGRLDLVDLLATDISADALDLAASNLAALDLAGDVRLAAADLLPGDEAPFHLVLANLPYIAEADIAGLPVALSFEPLVALTPGPDGLALIRRLLGMLPDVLAPGGVALLEIGAGQSGMIEAAVEADLPGWVSRVEADLAGLPRVAVVRRSGQALPRTPAAEAAR